jgi:ribose/xylose/arabinose/galactoside ABC-type transport system permease subunit
MMILLPKLRAALRAAFASEYVVVLLTVAYVVCFWPITPEIVSIVTAREVTIAMLPLLVLAVGQTFVLVIAGIDLSVTSVAGLASVLAASLMTGDGGYLTGTPYAVPLAFLSFPLVGCLVGAANGLFVAWFRMPAFIVTLASQMFLSGFAVYFTSLQTNGVSIGNLPQAFTRIGRGEFAGIPYALMLTAAAVAVAYWLLQKTVFGRWLFAVGNNSNAALVSGAPVKRVVLTAFMLSGIYAGIASIIYTGRVETGSPILADRVLLDVIGATVIGGVSLFGGKARIVWVFFGVLFLSVVDKGLQLLGLSQFVVFAVKGGVILLAAASDAYRRRLILEGSR